jgi:hypothetical protein
MSSLDLFLAKLRGLKINLSVDGDQLVCRAPKGVMTSELSASITAQKVEIIDFLKSAKQAVTKEKKIVFCLEVSRFRFPGYFILGRFYYTYLSSSSNMCA